MRQFWIKNAKGEVFDMNREDAFFSNPKGLGIARKTSYERIGYMWTATESYMSQKKPSGEMVFDGYEQYNEFIKIIQHTPLILMYQPLNEVYYMDVESFTIDKGEISHKDTFLTCKVTFNGVSPWYLNRVYRKENTGTGKVYTYQYPYTYFDSGSGEVTVRNDSGMDAYAKIVIYGPIKNPVWQAEQSGVKVAEGRVITELNSTLCLVVNSNPKCLEIASHDMLGRFVNDLYGQSDFNTERFINIPPGDTTIRVSHAGANEIKFYVEVTEFAG